MRCLLAFCLLCLTSYAQAFHWLDCWLTPNQQGKKWMEKGQFDKAKMLFSDKAWAASAAYRAGDYKKAASLFQQLHTSNGFYNQGNALAYQGDYQQAIGAYTKALALDPQLSDAVINRKLLQDLLKNNQQKQQNADQQNKDQSNKDKQNKDQQNKDKQDKDQSNKKKQNNDQLNKDKQDKDQSNKNKQNNDQLNKDEQNKDQSNKDKQNKDQSNKDKQNKNQRSRDKQQEKQKAQSTNQGLTNVAKEKQQAKEQWLQLIPDDPGGLLREKFLRDHLRKESGWY